MDNEGDARRATSLLYHVASAVALAWEGGRIHEMRGDARRLLLSRMVIDHRVLAGVVEKVGSDVTYVKPGDHVVTCLSVFCGTCDNCTTGRTVLCTDTTVKMLPGQSNRLSWARSEKLNQFLNLSSFAEQMLVHENAIVKIRKDMPLELAALIGCGVITGYGAVVNTAGVKAGETVAVIGCGGVGMAAINGVAIARAGRIIAIDTNPVKFQLAPQLGATHLP